MTTLANLITADWRIRLVAQFTCAPLPRSRPAPPAASDEQDGRSGS